MYLVLFLIICFLIWATLRLDQSDYIEYNKKLLMNEKCKVVLQTEDEYFMFDGFCYQYSDLIENSTKLRNMLKLE